MLIEDKSTFFNYKSYKNWNVSPKQPLKNVVSIGGQMEIAFDLLLKPRIVNREARG